MTDKQILSTSPMKQSVSLTSLPPSTSNGNADVSDSSIAAKMFIERPYHSLKVCIEFLVFIVFGKNQLKLCTSNEKQQQQN